MKRLSQLNLSQVINYKSRRKLVPISVCSCESEIYGANKQASSMQVLIRLQFKSLIYCATNNGFSYWHRFSLLIRLQISHLEVQCTMANAP